MRILRFSLLGLLLLAACSRVTPDNYNKVEAGMTRDEVYAVLGNPDDVSGSALGSLTLSSETWNGSRHRIRATFVGDKLATKTIEAAPEGSD